MPVDWNDFEVADQPQAVDWSDFEPVKETPETLRGLPRTPEELQARNFYARQGAPYLPPEGVARPEPGPLEPIIPIPRVESTDPRFKKAVKMVMDPLGDTEPSQRDLEGIAAMLNTGKGILEATESPIGIATAGLGALGGIASKLASLGWGLFGASQIPKSIQAYKEAKPGQEKLEAGMGVGLNVALPVGAATHLYPPYVRPTMPEVLARQISKAPLTLPTGMERPVEPLVERVAPRPVEPTPEPISPTPTPPEGGVTVPTPPSSPRVPIIEVQGRIYQGTTHADAYNKAVAAGEELEASPQAIANAESLGTTVPQPNWKGGWLVNGKPVFDETQIPTKPPTAPSLSPEQAAVEQARLASELGEEAPPPVIEGEAQPTVPAAGKAEGGVSAPPAPAIPEGGISPAKVQVEPWKERLYYGDVFGKLTDKLKPSKFGDYGRGFYVTPDRKFAKTFAEGTAFSSKPKGSGKIHEVEVTPPKNVFVADESPLTPDEIEWWDKDGFDMRGVKTRSQLVDEYGGRSVGEEDLRSQSEAWDDFLDKFGYDAVFDGKQLLIRKGEVTIKPPPTQATPTEAAATLTPTESTRLKSLTEKMESGKPLTSGEQKRYRALKDKVSPPEGEKGEVTAGTEATEIKALRKTDIKADPRLEMPGITKKSKPNSLIVALRDLDSVPVREVVLKSTGDPIQDAKVVAAAIRREAGSGRISLRESLAISTGPNGRAIYKFDTHPSGGMTWAKAQDWIDLVEIRKPPTTPPSTGEGTGGELQMAIVPGAKEFVEQDIIPFAKKAAQTVGETAKQMQALAAPPTMGPEASLAAGIVREHKAKLAQSDVQMREKFHKNLKDFDAISKAGSLAFIDRMERGGVQPTTPLHQLQSELRTEFDRRVAQVRALGTGKLQHLIQDYFPHIWKDPDAAVSWYARILGKRPLKGPASFLKRRTIPLTVDGVNAGLEPVTWNPVELSLLKFHEMDRYVMGQRIFQEFKDKGLAQFSRSDIPPSGFARIDDRVANVIEYRPTTRASGAPGAPERILRGHWYVQEDAARVLNNFLSPGLDRYKWFRAIRWIGNTMNMAQLGLSGYHFTFTMIDSGTSKLSLGLEQLARGELKGVPKSAQGLVPAVNQLEYYIRGNKVLQEYTKPGSVGAEYAKIVDALMASGGRVEMPRIFRNNSLENFFKAARTGNYPGAIIRAPFAAIEAVSYPLMQNIVPRLKLGVFSDMALAEIEKMGPNVSRDEYRARLGKIWDSVDNRMGEMVYDNLFWNRNLKDLSFLAVRAVGWNLGTIRELGGGVMDAATVIGRVRRGDPLVTRRMAYVVSLPVTVGIMGAMYQYAKTGQGPQELRDYFYPKTGKMLPDGTPERVNFPSYLKDIASYGMHPFKTLTNKLHPLWSEMAQMLDNKDYYGQQIRNPDDPLVKQVQEELAFVAKNFVPFSVRGAERRAGAKESKEIKAESFFGVMPISPEIARTAAQNKIMEYVRSKSPAGGRTPEEQERSEFTKDIEAQLQGPQDYAKAQQDLIKAQREGTLTRGQRLYQQNKLRFQRMEMARGRSKSQAQWLWRFEHLPLDQAQHVYDISTPVEKQLFKRALDLKSRRDRQPQPTE